MEPIRIFELTALAAIAAVFLVNLYLVLGRRVGRGAEGALQPAANPIAAQPANVAAVGALPPADDLATLRARDPSFDAAAFLQGARQAYEMIVKAFAAGDRATLKPLLSEMVMGAFDSAIKQREEGGRSESVELLQPPRADFESVKVTGDLVKAAVRFLTELRTRSNGPSGEMTEDRRTAEIWTFQRNLKSRDPNWVLVNVDPAEA